MHTTAYLISVFLSHPARSSRSVLHTPARRTRTRASPLLGTGIGSSVFITPTVFFCPDSSSPICSITKARMLHVAGQPLYPPPVTVY